MNATAVSKILRFFCTLSIGNAHVWAEFYVPDDAPGNTSGRVAVLAKSFTRWQ